MELIGKVLSSLPEQTGQGKNGPWVRQDFIIETEEQYPKKVCLSAWGDMVNQFKGYGAGTRLKVNFRIESREYNGRWYTDVRPWKAEVLQAGAPTAYAAAPAYEGAQTPAASYQNAGPAVIEEAENDLPF